MRALGKTIRTTCRIPFDWWGTRSAAFQVRTLLLLGTSYGLIEVAKTPHAKKWIAALISIFLSGQGLA